MLVSPFSSNISLYIEKNHVEILGNVLEMELKTYTQVGQKSIFEKLKFCIIFNLISFTSAQGSVKIRLTCPKVLLLINFTLIVDYELFLRTHSDGYIKSDKYLFFIKVGAANVLLKLIYL